MKYFISYMSKTNGGWGFGNCHTETSKKIELLSYDEFRDLENRIANTTKSIESVRIIYFVKINDKN